MMNGGQSGQVSHRRRRGAVLIVIVLLVPVLVLVAALVVEVGRLLQYRQQLRNLADASALSAAIDLAQYNAESISIDRVNALRPHHRLLTGELASIGPGDVEGGRWSGLFTPSSWGSASAVRVRVTHTPEWTLARLVSESAPTLSQTAIGLVGSQSSSRCLRPIAIPYASLLVRVGRAASDLSHVLTADDVRVLVDPSLETTFDVAQGGDAAAPGSFGWVELPPRVTSNKNNHMASQIRLGCENDPVRVGDILPAFSGNMNSSVIVDALRELCPTQPASQSLSRRCLPAPTVQLPIYDQTTGIGINVQYRVRYIGVFTLRGLEFTDTASRLSGELTTLAASTAGSFSPVPGPVRKGGLID